MPPVRKHLPSTAPTLSFPRSKPAVHLGSTFGAMRRTASFSKPLLSLCKPVDTTLRQSFAGLPPAMARDVVFSGRRRSVELCFWK